MGVCETRGGLYLRADRGVQAPGIGVEEDDGSEAAQLAFFLKFTKQDHEELR